MRRYRIQSAFVVAALGFFILLPPAVRAEVGVTQDQILIGRPLPLTGGAAGIGKAMAAGADVFFDKINKSGGVNGRKIKVITADDAFDPRKTSDLATKMVNEDKVFALFDVFGGAPTSAVIPLVKSSHVPLVAPFTGLETIRRPVVPEIYNVRSSFFEESETLVKQGWETLGMKDIGVFMQDDAYGNSGKAGVAKALTKYNAKIKAAGVFTRNSVDVDKAVDDLQKGGAKAVIVWAIPDSTEAFIKKAQAKGYNPTYLLTSSVGAPNVLALLKDHVAYIALAIPLTSEKSFALVNKFNADIAAAGKPELANGVFGLQGYTDAMIFVEAMKSVGPNLTREGLHGGFMKMKDFDIGGIKINFTPEYQQAFTQMFVRKIVGGKVVAD